MKKGAYDLGRKSIYYIVVVIIIAFLFVYVTNNFKNYQATMFSTMDKATDLVMVDNVMKCLSIKDADTGRVHFGIIDRSKLNKESLNQCLGNEKTYFDKAVKIKLDKIEETTHDPYFEYTEYKRTVIHDGGRKVLIIGIEKNPLIR